MVDKKRLIEALRCSLKIGAVCEPDCPYCFTEEIPEDWPDTVVRPDLVKDGKRYVYSCGIEDMTRDAIKYLEENL